MKTIGQKTYLIIGLYALVIGLICFLTPQYFLDQDEVQVRLYYQWSR